MLNKTISLRNFISREFFKAALIPLLIIEITLLALYFFMNTYLLDNSIMTLSKDRFSHLLGIADSQSRIMSEQLRSLSDLSLVLQAETTRFFNHPGQFPLPDPEPDFMFAPNGVYYKPIDNGGCSLFYSNRHSVGSERMDKALRSEALDPLFKEISEAGDVIVAVYLNTYDSMSRYYPFFQDVHLQLPPAMNVPEYNFYYLADHIHNPTRNPVWTNAYLDPMGMGWMMSCVVPVYRDDFLEGVAGIDITIKNFIDNLLNLQLPWHSHAFLVDSEGTIMAMPPDVERIFGLTELHDYTYLGKVQEDTRKPKAFNLLESALAPVKKPISELMRQNTGTAEFTINKHHYVVCQNTVSETGWKLMVIADRDIILNPITQLEGRARQVGYAAIGFMVFFYILFFLFLVANTRRMSGRIAATLGGLTNAIKRIGIGRYETKLDPSPVIELDMLASNFESMARDLKQLHENLEQEVTRANEAKDLARNAEDQLKEHQVHLEGIVGQRTHELRKANGRLREDIAKRQEVEENLNRERRQLLSIFDSINEPIYVSTPDTHELLFTNKAFKERWTDMNAGKCYEVLHQRTDPCPFCTNAIIFDEKPGDAHIWEHFNTTAQRWYRCIDKAIQWPDGRMVRYEMAIDITDQKTSSEEKKKLTDRLRRAEKMEALGTLAGGVAHDLNNILSGIVGYPDLLLMKMSEEDPLRKPLQTIQTSGKKATAIVQDLLTLARRGVSVMENTNVNAILDGYLDSLEHDQLLLHNPDVRLKTEISDDLLNCMGSPVHLSKMIINLVSNAAEAMSEGGEILISTYNQYVDYPMKGYDEVQEGDYVVFRVADQGAGIKPEDLDRIFEPFYTKRKMGRSGTGLGMAVVWGTVKDHHGYIEIKSNAGHGTVIEIYLPATRQVVDDDTSPYTLGNIKGRGETVLVVDDVEIQREIAVQMLTSLGYTPQAVASGEEAVAYLEHNHADLMLLDMIMEPNIDGLETYRRVTKIHPGQKAIIVSGYSETAAIRETQRLGAGKYVKKPYTIDELGRAVRWELQQPVF